MPHRAITVRRPAIIMGRRRRRDDQPCTRRSVRSARAARPRSLSISRFAEITADHLRDLDIQQMRRMKDLPRVK
jgi:hypothetical protein